MQAFTTRTSIACPLPLSSVDTDQLIPARFMKRSRAEGYGGYLLYDQRFDQSGAPIESCPINHANRQGAQVLVARRNFGSGSSREAAVYALVDYGITCVIAPSFGDIFASNAVNNGLLPAIVNEEDNETLLSLLGNGEIMLTVDLTQQVILCAERKFDFLIDPVWRTKLLNGWDDIDLTQSYKDVIKAFEIRDRAAREWMQPDTPKIMEL